MSWEDALGGKPISQRGEPTVGRRASKSDMGWRLGLGSTFWDRRNHTLHAGLDPCGWLSTDLSVSHFCHHTHALPGAHGVNQCLRAVETLKEP